MRTICLSMMLVAATSIGCGTGRDRQRQPYEDWQANFSFDHVSPVAVASDRFVEAAKASASTWQASDGSRLLTESGYFISLEGAEAEFERRLRRAKNITWLQKPETAHIETDGAVGYVIASYGGNDGEYSTILFTVRKVDQDPESRWSELEAIAGPTEDHVKSFWAVAHTEDF